ncbi:hypothetical protein KZX50_19805 [Bacillus infantis]|uniref:hypothetical protein n=1 Tax=Bacillus infantis TaxID=324767 RepID=UPI002005FAC9|nr:hypothetical protein [Bacillus infantis]MCK6207690.1 hypothetical protein [Bacillus infantis]
MLRKVSFVIMSLIMGISVVTPSLAQASQNEGNEFTNVTVTQEDEKNTEVLVTAINELDEKLDMENLHSNSQEEINQLSEEGKKLYTDIIDYQNQLSSPLTGEDMVTILNSYFIELSEKETSATKEIDLEPKVSALVGGINYKEYKISNSKIQQLNNLVDYNTGFWGVATAIAKIWAKNPTVLTLMLAALPVLGIAGLNTCNSKGKGVIITKFGTGATNSYSCKSQ